MLEFFADVARFEFLRNGLIVACLASIACGVIGSYVVVRRITYIAGGIAHCVLGGIGAAQYLHVEHGIEWLQPIHGAVVAALGAAALIGWVSLRAREREDTVISAIWAIGMATGVLFLARTAGYAESLENFLFGDILLVTRTDVWLLGALDVLIVVVGLSLYNQFQAVCFDEEFARLRGLNTEFLYLLLLLLTALTVVALVKVVGIVLVIALLTLPVAIAGLVARSLWQMMLAATGLSIVFTIGGMSLSFSLDFPPGATIVVLAGAVYLLSIIFSAISGSARVRA